MVHLFGKRSRRSLGLSLLLTFWSVGADPSSPASSSSSTASEAKTVVLPDGRIEPLPTCDSGDCKNDEDMARLISSLDKQQSPLPVCSLYMARSTIPGAGLGVFTGRDLPAGEMITWADIQAEDAWFQDLIIPIMDKYKTIPYRGHQRFLSWLGYVWAEAPDTFYHTYSDASHPYLSRGHHAIPPGLNGADHGLHYFYYEEKYEGEQITLNVLAPGIASLVNSYDEKEDWINVGLLPDEAVTLNWETGDDDDEEMVDPLWTAYQSGSSRLAPGSGFFTRTDIAAGQELLIYYGDLWHARQYETIEAQDPTKEKNIPDYRTLEDWMIDEADGIDYEAFPSEQDKRQREHIMKSVQAPRQDQFEHVEEIRRRHVEEVVRRAAESEALGTNPEEDNAAGDTVPVSPQHMRNTTLKQDEDQNTMEDEFDDENPPARELEWLQEHGACLDNLKAGKSTIPGAGRGAFATRFMPQHSVLSTAPLLALKRADLVLYETDEDSSKYQHTLNFDNIVGQELLLNYCYGHAESDLLLVPYSPVVNFINHADDLSKVNAEIRWPSPERAKQLLQRSPKDWLDAHPLEVTGQSGQLLMEFVALRDIGPGEEILINYGDAWKEAWEHHGAKDSEWQGFRHEIGVPQDFFPSNWLNQVLEYEVVPIESLQPGEIRPLTWKHNGRPVAKNAFVVGLPPNLTQHMYQFAEQRGIINLYEQLLAENVLDSDEWYVFDADQHNESSPEQWFAHRYKSVGWDFNMHYMAAWNEAARNSVFQNLGKVGYDQVLHSIGTYFGLDYLTCFHSSFMGVSEADKSKMHTDVFATREKGFNIIFPIVTVDGSKPELDVQSDNADVVVAVKYEHDRAFVMSDWGYHRTSAVEYEGRGQIRIVMGMYCAQIDESNHLQIKYIYDGEDPSPFMDQFELPMQEIHWDKSGEHRLPR